MQIRNVSADLDSQFRQLLFWVVAIEMSVYRLFDIPKPCAEMGTLYVELPELFGSMFEVEVLEESHRILAPHVGDGRNIKIDDIFTFTLQRVGVFGRSFIIGE
jgi:hypothetical protein